MISSGFPSEDSVLADLGTDFVGSFIEAVDGAREDFIRIVASKRNDATDARSAALSDRDNQLRATSDMEWALAHTAARGAADYATFVDTLTFTPPAE